MEMLHGDRKPAHAGGHARLRREIVTVLREIGNGVSVAVPLVLDVASFRAAQVVWKTADAILCAA
jgi:hypothetical protein